MLSFILALTDTRRDPDTDEPVLVTRLSPTAVRRLLVFLGANLSGPAPRRTIRTRRRPALVPVPPRNSDL
jgi:hypothetical protein